MPALHPGPNPAIVSGSRDVAIESAVRAELESLRSFPFDRIAVSVARRIVTLRGHVESTHQSRTAEDAVRRIPGVGAVINALVIPPD
jgi:osmotically-inducible protein OsmY